MSYDQWRTRASADEYPEEEPEEEEPEPTEEDARGEAEALARESE